MEKRAVNAASRSVAVQYLWHWFGFQSISHWRREKRRHGLWRKGIEQRLGKCDHALPTPGMTGGCIGRGTVETTKARVNNGLC